MIPVYRGVFYFLFLSITNVCAAMDTIQYMPLRVDEWRVNVERALVENKDPRLDRILSIVQKQLRHAEKVLPPHHIENLKDVAIWISEANGSGVEYYFFKNRIYDGQINPLKFGGVEIKNVSQYLKLVKIAPGVIIHELAHAFHKKNYDKIDKLITRSERNARWEKLYKKENPVRNHPDQSVYASSNVFEYFAELTEIYFSSNYYYPYNREDLKKHDPMGFEMIEKAWK